MDKKQKVTKSNPEQVKKAPVKKTRRNKWQTLQHAVEVAYQGKCPDDVYKNQIEVISNALQVMHEAYREKIKTASISRITKNKTDDEIRAIIAALQAKVEKKK